MNPIFSAPLHTFFGKRRWLLLVCVVMLFVLGIGFRLLNLTNPPLDIHAWRQYGSAAFARALYQQMLPNTDPAQRQSIISTDTVMTEPPITEALVAVSYLVAGGEYLWIARLWTTLFWVVGGLALFALVRRMTSADGAVIALGYYLLLPFGITTTRAFLPEPFMIMWILLALYAIVRWVETSTWKWAVGAGVFCGLAVLSKVFAAFPLIPAFALVVLVSFGLRRTLTNVQFWLIVVLAAIIPAAYYIFPNPQSGGSYLATWVLPYTHRLLDISFYITWLHYLNGNFDLAVVLIAAASIIILEKRWRAMCIGLWVGYGLLGAAVPELVYSHLYYSLVLVPVVAISLGPISAFLIGKISEQGRLWHILFLGLALVAVGYSVFMSRKETVAVDYRQKALQWQELGARLPRGKIIALVEDYATPLMYYSNRYIAVYPYSWDHEMGAMAGHAFDENADNLDYFNSEVKGYSYFLVTMFDQFDSQPYLKRILYDRYPIFEQGSWYVVFDLTHPK
jgi:4-amino-4-deoxy-L-arabinose transferase-like glycosyltransferase